jgi:hypothetical protein
LQISIGGLHAPHAQLELHVRDPDVPHVVVQLPLVPDAW